MGSWKFSTTSPRRSRPRGLIVLRRQDGALQRRSTPIWRRWREEGLPALSDKPRCGAPRQWDEEDAQRQFKIAF